MTTSTHTIPPAWNARLKLFFGTAVIFASLAVAGQAQGLYPKTILPTQTADVVRPVLNPCTQLEIAAQIAVADCGTLTLSDVVVRLGLVEDDDDRN